MYQSKKNENSNHTRTTGHAVMVVVIKEDVIVEGVQHLKEKTQRDNSKNKKTYLNHNEVEPSSHTRVSSVKILFSRSF